MKEIFLPFIISLIAGLSTLIGYLFIYIKPSKTSDFIGASLAFSMTIMMIISITDLIPEGFFYLKKEYNIFLAILILIIIFCLGINIIQNSHRINHNYQNIQRNTNTLIKKSNQTQKD